jgi:hypothetical protein
MPESNVDQVFPRLWYRHGTLCPRGPLATSRLLLCILALLGALPAAAPAQDIVVDARDPGEAKGGFLLPYAFNSDLLDWAIGAAVGGRGYFQEQVAFAGTAIASTNGSVAAYLYLENLELPFGERLFVSPRITTGWFENIDSYQDGNPMFAGQRAGSNDSSQNNYLRSDGTDQWYRFVLRYVLPLGQGKETIVPRYVLDRGLLVDGPTEPSSWNPLHSGRTLLEVEPFYRRQDLDGDFGTEGELETGGTSLRLRRWNVDLPLNPSRGSAQRIGVTMDPGVQDDDSSYVFVDLELTKYFDLGESRRFRQRVLALDFWTADTPTWDEDFEDGRRVIDHRPPNYFGATLGGVDRLRGYSTARYNDKAAIYYAAELRMIPRWHPLGEIQWLKRFLQIDWWQFVPFVEVGRVAPSWNLDTLHTDMRYTAGLGIRALVNRMVLRVDAGKSSEGIEVQMMISHPFPEL